MIDISICNLKKAFEQDKNILDGLSFDINSGERVGLLGKNGAGKTTLFKIITGELSEDEGEVVIGGGKRVGLISQIPVYPEGMTVMDVLRSAFHRADRIFSEMRELEELMASGAASQSELKRYGELSQSFEAEGGYDSEVELGKVANGLEISLKMREQAFDSLSGGEQTRVNLARLILEKTDILLLDEPTNHLDLNAVEWLEEYLLRFEGTVLAVSHDRYFLDRVVTRIIELNEGKAEHYSGNYSFYVAEKQARYEERLKRYEQEQKKISQLDEAARRLSAWGTGNKRLMSKAAAIEKRMERIEKTDRPAREKTMKARFSEREFRADEVMIVSGLKMSFEGRTLFENVELLIEGGERIGLIGDNGTGKTTFTRILLGELEPDEGRVKLGPSVKWAYLPQNVSFPHPERSLLDTLIFELGCSHQSARNRLGAFKFSGDDVYKTVGMLSGGERSRLKLCMLMDDEINLLILDEPTNHLDIASREWIEQALEDYEGALIFISHDRYFINRFATRIWALKDNRIRDFDCGFAKYREAMAREVKAGREKRETVKKGKPKREQPPEKQLARVESEIARCEAEKEGILAEIDENASDYEALMELESRLGEVTRLLDELYERWAEIGELVED